MAIPPRRLQSGRTPSLAAFCLVLTAGGCREPSPRERFESEVVPVLESHCSGAVACHGVDDGSEARGEVVDWSKFFFRVDAQGNITDVDGAYEASKVAVDTSAPALFSTLLRKPLATEYGGLPHWGRTNFETPEDDAFRAIADWIDTESGGGEEVEPLDAREQLFADEVQPVLVGAMCMGSNCHGIDAPVPFRLEAGIEGEFSDAMSRRNYEMSRTMLALDGDPLQSRLLKKSLPLHAGGIAHKGGNVAFLVDVDDDRAAPMIEWACEERSRALGGSCLVHDEAPMRGFVYVHGPVGPGEAFDLDSFVPGTELMYAEVEGTGLAVVDVVDLTSAHHGGAVDIRDPAVDPSGERVVFAMRRSADEGHALYELDLEGQVLRSLTPHGAMLPGGGLATDRDPTYDPAGHVWFASTRRGVVEDRGATLDADLYELDPETGEVTRRTVTPHVERKPVFFALGEEAGGEMSFTALRALVPEHARAHPFRFPPGLATEYHQHFGITPPETLFFDMRELADGRYVATIGELDGQWRAGRLGVVDRNFGPELNELAEDPVSGLPFYSPPLRRLDPDATSSGESSGAYRDAVGLADGRVLVAYAPGSVNLDDPDAEPRFRVEALTLQEALDGTGPSIVDRQILVDDGETSVRDPEPVWVRNPGEIAEARWDPEANTGTFQHQGMGLIDGLLTNLQPSGEKRALKGIAAARLVAATDVTPKQRAPVSPAETLHGHEGATTTTLGHHGPQRVLAEISLAEDGTFQVDLPAGVPFRVQPLDVDGMALGVTHNRWYYVSPGQTIKQGVDANSGAYDQRCAACHGSRDGDPDHAFVEHDVLTMASATHSRYVDGNPRLPIAAPIAGPETAVEIDFAADVQPILDRSCAVEGCHSGPDPAATLALDDVETEHYNLAYENLLRDGDGSGSEKLYVDEPNAKARTSFLIEKILGRELDAPRTLASPGTPHPDGEAIAPTEDDVLTLIRWIDLGASFRGKVEEP